MNQITFESVLGETKTYTLRADVDVEAVACKLVELTGMMWRVQV